MTLPPLLRDRLSLPLIGSPMFIISQPDLVIAQCRSGIVGAFPSLNARPVGMFESWLQQLGETLGESDAPFAVNLIVHRTNSRLEEDLALCVRYRVPIVITSLGARARVKVITQRNGQMIASMTGFARETEQIEGSELTWEIRSVNHRYLDVSLRLGQVFRAKESLFRKILTESFDRGRIDAQLHYHASAQPTDSGRLQPERVRVLREWAAAVQEMSPESAPLSVAEVLNWSGVIIADSADPQMLVDQAQVLLQRTVSSLQSQRHREGESLGVAIAKRVVECRRIAQGVQSMLGEIEAGFRQRLLERVAGLDSTPDPGRLEQELVILLGRTDISEELDRLLIHLRETENVLARDEPVGRRLDFLMQELNREANTLGSKSAHTATSAAAVDLKVLIEQMREQVQNIE